MRPASWRAGLELTDAELVGRIRNGDKAAFRELARRHADPLFRLAYSLLGNASDAEDVVQEAMLAAHRGIGSFEGRSAIGTWLRSIVAFQASKARRRRAIRSTLPLHAGDAAPAMEDPGLRSGSPAAAVDSRVDVMAMLETLSPEHREVIVLRELQNLSYDEISAMLKVPLGTVMSRLHRARQELRQRFSGYLS